jgi:VanZ family protein
VDKVQHLVGFAVPVALVLVAGSQSRASRLDPWRASHAGVIPARFLGAVLALFAVQAVASELVQAAFLPARAGDVWDVVADLLGIAVGWGLFATVRRRHADRRRVVMPR